MPSRGRKRWVQAMKILPFILTLSIKAICIGQDPFQNLNVAALNSIDISQKNKVLLKEVFLYLENIPIRDRYTQEFIDSIKKTPDLFNLSQIDNLKRSITDSEAIILANSDEPLLHLVGFWLISQRQVSQKEIVLIFQKIASIQKKSYQWTFYCFCEPYSFDYFDKAIIKPTPYMCFDMITHKYQIWSDCVLVIGKYRRKANRIIKKFNDRMQSEMVIIH